MKAKRMQWYTDKLKTLVHDRKGHVDGFLDAQIMVTAHCWMILDKIGHELEKVPMTLIETGSNGQQKTILNPLLAQYDRTSRTLKAHLGALGINFDATPSKVSETDQDGKTSALSDFINGI